MQIKKQPSPCEIIVEKSFSKEELLKLEEEILKAKCKEINIPGFRPGNAPLHQVRESLITSHKWEELMGIKLQEKIISDWSMNKEAELGEIVRVVDIKTVKNEPITLECHFEYFPRLKEGELSDKYKQLKIDKKQKVDEIEVADKEIEEGLLELQKRRTMLKPIAEGLGKDTYAFIKIGCSVAGKEVGDSKAGQDLFQWGIEQYGKVFDEKTKNMKEGDEIVFDSDKDDKKILEKFTDSVGEDDKPNTQIKVKVEKVFESKAPEINDDFAKSLGKFHDLAELKSNMKHGMILEKLYKELDARRELLIQALLDSVAIEVPDSIVERSAHNYQMNFKKQISKMGEAQKVEALKQVQNDKKEEFNKIFEEKARRELKLQRILEAIAVKEKIIPSDEEIEKEVRKILHSFKSPKEAEKSLGEPEEFRSRVILSLCFDKTLQFLEKENDLLDDINKEIDKIEGEHHHGHKH